MSFRDVMPQALPSLEPAAPHPPRSQPNARPSHICRIFRTPRNSFGLIRQYFSEMLPSHDPEEQIESSDLFDEPTDTTVLAVQPPAPDYSPYPNRSSFLLGDWYWNHGAQKSRESFSQLIRIVGNEQFRPEDVQHTNWKSVDVNLGWNNFDHSDESDDGGDEELDEDAGWHRTPITIPIPFHSRSKHSGISNYLVGDLYHRSFVDVIREKLANAPDIRRFHYEPFELFWNPTPASSDVRVHGELYTSPAFLEAHQALQDSPREPGCDLQRCVVALMFFSDGTHLTSFGTAKLWPGYLYFGNESKYNRCKPSCHLANHVAYFLDVSRSIHFAAFLLDACQLPDAIKDFVAEQGGEGINATTIIKHCRRELMHAQWNVLLDAEFIKAYEHGIVSQCCDGIRRRFYPRFITYAADYKEKWVF